MAIRANPAVLVLLLLGMCSQVALAQQQNQLETPRLPQRDQRREFIAANGAADSFKFRFGAVTGASKVENAAALTLQVDKAFNPFLSTLTSPGEAQFLTVLKPCGNVLPHVHPRATELYTILKGIMNAGVAQENGGLQNITLQAQPGEVFVAPQGLLHFNHNNQCGPLVFLQTFNNGDPGALNVISALAALNGATPIGAAAIKASNAGTITASPHGAFSLDPDCLARCKLPSTGAANGLDGLSADFLALFAATGGGGASTGGDAAAAPGGAAAAPGGAATGGGGGGAATGGGGGGAATGSGGGSSTTASTTVVAGSSASGSAGVTTASAPTYG